MAAEPFTNKSRLEQVLGLKKGALAMHTLTAEMTPANQASFAKALGEHEAGPLVRRAITMFEYLSLPKDMETLQQEVLGNLLRKSPRLSVGSLKKLQISDPESHGKILKLLDRTRHHFGTMSDKEQIDLVNRGRSYKAELRAKNFAYQRKRR